MNKDAVFICDWSGKITEIIFSSFHEEFVTTEKTLFDVFNHSSCDKLERFLAEVKRKSYPSGWEINLDFEGEIITVFLSGAIFSNNIVIIISGEKSNLLSYYEELLKLNNIQTNRIRELERDLVQARTSEKDSYLDSVSKLNNELINTRRELEKKNLELQSLNKKLQEISITDELTSLYNRRFFFEIITDEFHRAKRLGIPISLLSIDINSFKEVNDTFGHLEGDKLLKKLATILKKHTRDGLDHAFRFGGDEFLLLLEDCNEDKALDVASRIDAEFKNHTNIASLSYGAVQLDLEESNIEKLIQEADIKMYEHKSKVKQKMKAYIQKNP